MVRSARQLLTCRKPTLKVVEEMLWMHQCNNMLFWNLKGLKSHDPLTRQNLATVFVVSSEM